MNNTFKGFCLFKDIEDEGLRNRNRAVVLANIFSDNSKDAKVTPKGATLVLGYFQAIPEYERGKVQALFVENMKQRGFKIAA